MRSKRTIRSGWVRTGVLLASIVVILIGVFYNVRNMDLEFTSQLQQSLRETAGRNASTLVNQVGATSHLLESIQGTAIPGAKNSDAVLLNLDRFVERYGLKRLGYCTADGTTHSTDGVTVNLSERAFFQESMAGRRYISGVLTDAMAEAGSGEQVVVLSAPVWDGDKVTGVYCLTYDAEQFSHELTVSCYDGYGFSIAVNPEGEIMVADNRGRLKLASNLFRTLGKDQRNEAAIDTITAAMARGETCAGTVYLPDVTRFYAQPVKLMDGDVTWYSITMVSEYYMQTRRTKMVDNLRWTLVFVFAIVAVAGVIIGLSYTDQQARVNQIAFVDPLTKGNNYAKFCQQMSRAAVKTGWIVSMDISGFKNVNLALGQKRSDDLLISLWKLINNSIYENEFAGRLREDHFVIYMVSPEREELVARIHWITERIARLFGQYNVPALSPCFGIMHYEAGDELEDVHTKAKIAREFVREQKDCSYAFFAERDFERLVEEQHLQDQIVTALKQEHIEAWYQPKYASDTEKLVGAEALVRWRENNTVIMPGKFISLLERNGTIADLDEYMFRVVSRQQHAWEKQLMTNVPVSVNLSRASLYKADIVQRYLDILNEYHLQPSRVQIEVTETAMAGNAYVSSVMAAFKQKGFRVLMDDFGSGYSALGQLNTTCFDTIKLDKCLVDRIGKEDGETLLLSMIQMGHRMGFSVTAEGVEYEEQAIFLRDANCDDIQGYFYGKPMPAEEFGKLLKEKLCQA